MLGRATKGRKCLQMLSSDITSKDYVSLKRDAKKQKQLAEEFVISLLYTAEDQRRDICELTNG